MPLLESTVNGDQSDICTYCALGIAAVVHAYLHKTLFKSNAQYDLGTITSSCKFTWADCWKGSKDRGRLPGHYVVLVGQTCQVVALVGKEVALNPSQSFEMVHRQDQCHDRVGTNRHHDHGPLMLVEVTDWQ